MAQPKGSRQTMMKNVKQLLAGASSALILLAGCGSSGGGGDVFVADGRGGFPGNLYNVDAVTGRATVVGPIVDLDGNHYGVTGMAFDTDGTLYATVSSSKDSDSVLITIKAATGEATVVGPLEDEDGFNHRAIAELEFADGILYGWSESWYDDGSPEDNDAFVSIDTATGEVTRISGPGECNSYGDGMAWDGETMFLLCRGGIYDAEDPGDDGTLDTVDLETGEVSTGDHLDGRISPFIDEDGDGCVNYNAAGLWDGRIIAVENDCNGDTASGQTAPILVAIDPDTAELTEIGPLPLGIDALAVRQ